MLDRDSDGRAAAPGIAIEALQDESSSTSGQHLVAPIMEDDLAAAYAVNNDYTGDNQAAIIADSWRINDKLTVNAGFRLEHQSISATMENRTSADASTNPLNLYDYGATELAGTYTGFDHGWWAHAFSVGADYELMKNLNAFVSYNQGYVLPTFDDVRNNGGASYEAITHVKQVQGGVKTSSDLYTLYLTGFYTNFGGQPASQILTDGTIINYTLSSESEGVEFETTLRPFKTMGNRFTQGINLSFSGDYQHGTYTAGGPGITGSEVARQPNFQFRLTPSYTLDTDYGTLKLFATTTYVDSRWGDQFDTQFLPSYMTEDVGASLQMDDGLEFRFTGTNITNTLAITEGNSRVVGSGSVGGVFLGRPLFGASYEGSVAIHF